MGRAQQLDQAKGPGAAARTDSGSFVLGKLHIWEVATWENTPGKLPLGKMPFGKYLTSFR